MRIEHIDYAVVGYSLAGVSAALTLAESGDRVLLLDFDRDTDSIDDLPRIHSTPLGPSTSGEAFGRTTREALRHAGVDRQTSCHVTNIYSEAHAIVECSDRRWSCKGVVLAPNGTEPGLHIEASAGLHGFGISYSAAADAPFFISRRVAVYGDGPRVVEHAWVAAQYASEVFVLIKQKDVAGDVEALTQLRSSPSIAFEQAVMLRSLQVANDRTLSGIDIESSGGRRPIDVSALFVAQHLVPMINVVSGGVQTDRVIFAGLAAGVEYWDHAGLVNDGRRAAGMLLRAQR